MVFSRDDFSAARHIRIEPEFFGFRVELFGRPRVVVELAPWLLRVRSAGAAPAELDLADGDRLYAEIAQRLNPKTGRRTQPRYPTTTAEFRLRKGIERHRIRLIARVPSQVYRVHERVHREGGGWSTALHRRPEFYDRRYLVADVLRFRAAAIAVSYADELLKKVRWIDSDSAALDRLESWRTLFAPDETDYGSLRRTLASLSFEVPASLLPALRFVHLPRPVTDPLELSTICAAIVQKQQTWRNAEIWPERLEILLHANAAEIEAGIQRLAEHTGQLRDPLGEMTLRRFVRYLDVPDRYAGRLGGLVEKTLRWHIRVHRSGLEELLESLDLPPGLKRLDTPTVRPKFPIPKDCRIRFLDTVGSILEEGRSMRHCVGTLAAAAVHGYGFFFHVEIGGTKATVELNRHGRVVEAAGPCNSGNEAVRWGSRTLEELARGPEDSNCDGDAFAPMRERFGGARWLEIAELLHRRAGEAEPQSGRPTT